MLPSHLDKLGHKLTVAVFLESLKKHEDSYDTKEVFEVKKNIESVKNALIGDVAKTRIPEMDVSLHSVQSVTQVLMGEPESFTCLNFR